MNIPYIAIIAFAALAQLVAQARGEGAPFLSYRLEGEYSAFENIMITIAETGETAVSIKKRNEEPDLYATTLSKEELGFLNTLIDSTGFFTLPEVDQSFRIHSGETHLTIVRGARKKTLVFRDRPDLHPLTGLLWQLMTQATATLAIESNGDIYTAMSALNQRSAGAKALQPERLKAPLIAFVEEADDRQKIEWSLEGLAWITTPGEFAGLIASEIKRPDRKDLMLTAIPKSGNLPEAHWRALGPFYLNYVKQHQPRRNDLTKDEGWALEEFTRSLGNLRYGPAIPMFLERLEECTQKTPTPEFIPLCQMGQPGLQALIPYLESPDAVVRGNTITLLMFASRGNPRSKYSNPFTAAEYKNMIKVFQDTILPRLTQIAESDPSAEVRKRASEAIPEIRSEIAK
jgi:hypothetical protein